MTSRQQRNKQYDRVHTEAEKRGPDTLRNVMREFCLTDLFYLLTRACSRMDIDNDFLFHRCMEVQADPDGYLDLWAREHYKSTIITFGKSIQDILVDPEITIGIFSHTKPIARAFLRQIKYELETNARLKHLFSEILYENPRKESPNWSEEKGIVVNRKTNPKEATIEAHGLVDGQPTSKHFSILVYDDVVTRESVTTPEMIHKTTEAWALSLNLGAHGGRRRHIGTRYHFNDSYKTILDREAAVPRIHPATDDGTVTGEPVFLERVALNEKRRDMGPYVFGCQMLQDPKADEAQGFDESWLRYYDREPDPATVNFYILVDPANAKRKENDYTSMFVLGLGADRNYYVYDMVRDRLNLTERANLLFELHREYLPLDVGYEHYGMQADIQHIEYLQEQRGYRFNITPLGGTTPKNDRIRKLIPPFEQGRVWFPRVLYRRDYEGKKENLVERFIKDEFLPFPVMLHDDMLDCLARILHPELVPQFPKMRKRQRKESWQDKLKKKLMADSSRTTHMAT